MHTAGMGREGNSRVWNTGWTNAYGLTGFSIKKEKDNKITINVVVSGKKAGIRYRSHEDEEGMKLHEPVNADALHEKIKNTLKKLGYEVEKVHTGSYQMHWDDDINYSVVAKRPEWLSDKN
jgi:hypothetical protein